MTAVNFQEYQTLQNVNDCVEESLHQPILIFKHSSVCPTSFYAKNQMDEYLQTGGAKVYMVVVQDQRPLSQAIASTLNVNHESPQLIFLRNGEAKKVLNHHEITMAAVQDAVS